MSNTYSLTPVFKQKFTDANGTPLAGGLLYSYVATTTTPLATYTDETGGTPNTNPVVLDSSGSASVWMGPGAYKFVLTDSSGVTQWTVDEVVQPGAPVTISLTSQVTGVLPEANGGTNQSTYALGDTIYSSATNTLSKLSGNTSATKKFLSQTGTGTVSAAPAWGQPAFSDITGSASLTSQVTGTLPLANGGTGQTTQQAAMDALAGSQSSGKYLRSDGTHTTLSLIQAADVPTLNQNTTGTALNVTGTVAIANGGTGQITQQAAINALTGSQTSGRYLRSDGTNSSLTAIQAADVPTLNQSTTGTASNVTGTVAIANGGSGQTTATAAFNALAPSQTSNSGKFLTTDGTNSSWGTPSGVATAYNIVSKTANYTAVAGDLVQVSAASFTITLPTAASISGQQIVVKKTDSSLSNIITMATTSAQTIDGSAASGYTLNTIGETYVFVSDGSNWIIAEHKTQTPWATNSYFLTATSAYTFTITASTVTIGAVYSNNGQTFTATASIASGTTLTCYGTGTPGASGTLTLVSGSGPGTIAFSARTITGVPAKGTTAVDTFNWRRNGSDMQYVYSFNQTAAGTAGTGLYLWPLPVGITMDTTVVSTNGLSTTDGRATSLGYGMLSNTSTGIANSAWSAYFIAYDSTHLSVKEVAGSGTGTAALVSGSASPGALSATSLNIYLTGSIPISGWVA